jgi:hypothetical protein
MMIIDTLNPERIEFRGRELTTRLDPAAAESSKALPQSA